jgi:putative peptidoglycan lipid II flippase
MLWVGLIGAASKGMAALGGILLAYRFGANQATDAYLLAKSVPIGVYLILDSVVYNTFVPLLRRREKSDALFRTLLLIFFFGATLVAATVYFGAAQLVALLARGADNATQAEAIQLQKITAWAIVYAVPAACLKAWNAAQSRYVAAALDGFVLSGVLLLTLLLAPAELGITPIAMALPVAFVVLLAIQSGLAGKVLRLSPRLPMSDLPRRYLGKLMAPLLLLNVAQQAQVLLVIALASFHGSGAVSQVNYSYAIAQIPVGILDLILFSTIFPFAAKLAADRRLHDMLRTFHSAARTVLLLTLPTALWVVLMRSALVDALLTRGHFDAADAQTTTALLLGHGLAIPAWVLEALGCRMLFALGQHRRYLGIVTLRLVAFSVFAPLCLAWLGLPGISLAFAGSCVVGAVAAIWTVHRALPRTPMAWRSDLLRSGAILAAVTALTGASTVLVRWGLADYKAVCQISGSAILAALIVFAGARILIARSHIPS